MLQTSVVTSWQLFWACFSQTCLDTVSHSSTFTVVQVSFGTALQFCWGTFVHCWSVTVLQTCLVTRSTTVLCSVRQSCTVFTTGTRTVLHTVSGTLEHSWLYTVSHWVHHSPLLSATVL